MNFIPLAKPSISEEDIENVTIVLRSGMLVQGKNVLILEKQFTEYHKMESAIALANGTATLHLALLASGIGVGDEVIVPAFSYAATANVVELTGAMPVFADIDIATFNISFDKIEEKISKRTKAIIPVHEFGLSCNIGPIVELAAKHKLIVIEDAACALGATAHGKLTGASGDFGSFSLHPRKSVTSGEGGVLLTNNKAAARKIKSLRNHGIDPDKQEMDFIDAGFNYRMTDFQAALVLSQFERLNSNLSYKNQIADIYLSEIKNLAISLPVTPDDYFHTWQTFHLMLDDKISQKEAIVKLREKNIGTNYGAQCIPALTYYTKKYKLDVKKNFPNSFKAYTQGLAIPIYERLTKEEAYYITKCLNEL